MLIYIWNESWSARQAIRSTINGYEFKTLIEMFMMAVNEIKYKLQR